MEDEQERYKRKSSGRSFLSSLARKFSQKQSSVTAAETMGTETGKKFNKIDIDRADVDRLDVDRVDIDRVDTEDRENTKDKEMKVFSSAKIIVDTKHVEKEKKEKEEGKEEENNEDQIIKSLDEGSLKEDHKSNLQVSQSLPPFWHNQTTRSYPRKSGGGKKSLTKEEARQKLIAWQKVQIFRRKSER
ncbi:uncharacterized protein LOC111710464 [Eurytemora carolleeae]|uniref:uncharacterized protein LOC111710464 n=1 Tax=Eurytemora carolleeae TaxID=1294199 RepID=UPI000C7630F0|nr:uncharacterized protein LOC111710464 [Eurytemora carolleeae]|eukprot:XP_023340330.1 uncharacterized protein LOC111710464 [Eurytemora affinis]